MNDIKQVLDSAGRLRDWTPADVAEMFAGMDSEGQAQFFNAVAEIARRTYAGGCMAMQLQCITEEDGLTNAGRYVMQSIGDYSHWGIHRIIERDVLAKARGETA